MANNKAKAAAHAIGKASKFADSDELATVSYRNAQLRLETVQDDWRQYCQLHEELLSKAKEEDVEIYIEEKEIVRADYFRANAALQDRMEALRPNVQAQEGGTDGDNRQIQVQVNMPFQQHDLKNTWGEFDGTYTKWIGFHDRFAAAIHNNDKVSPAFKFSYLKKSLTGRAARTLGEWQLTDENYNEAWERLKQIYNQKYLIGRDHLRQLLRLPELRDQPTANDLQRMSNTTHETLRQLKALGLPVENWDFFIVHILNERFDQETARQWELQRVSDQPKLATMLEFIDKQAAALSNVSGTRQTRTGSKDRYGTESSRDSKVRDNSANKARVQERATAPRGGGRNKSRLCEVCSSDHQIWECPDFVERRAICPNCLKHGHKENNCFQRGCVRCPGAPKHNIHLCPTKEVNKHVLPSMRVQDDKHRAPAPATNERKGKRRRDSKVKSD